MITSIQAEIIRLRAEKYARLQEEQDRYKSNSQQQNRQWEQIDRPRLLNMMFLPENHDDVRNATLSQILDKIQRDILDNHNNHRKNPGNNNPETGQQSNSGLLEPITRSIPNIPGYGERFNPEDFLVNEDSYNELYREKFKIMNKNLEELFSRPISEIIKDFRKLLE
jgi:hypothetical protein